MPHGPIVPPPECRRARAEEECGQGQRQRRQHGGRGGGGQDRAEGQDGRPGRPLVKADKGIMGGDGVHVQDGSRPGGAGTHDVPVPATETAGRRYRRARVRRAHRPEVRCGLRTCRADRGGDAGVRASAPARGPWPLGFSRRGRSSRPPARPAAGRSTACRIPSAGLHLAKGGVLLPASPRCGQHRSLRWLPSARRRCARAAA